MKRNDIICTLYSDMTNSYNFIWISYKCIYFVLYLVIIYSILFTASRIKHTKTNETTRYC